MRAIRAINRSARRIDPRDAPMRTAMATWSPLGRRMTPTSLTATVTPLDVPPVPVLRATGVPLGSNAGSRSGAVLQRASIDTSVSVIDSDRRLLRHSRSSRRTQAAAVPVSREYSSMRWPFVPLSGI